MEPGALAISGFSWPWIAAAIGGVASVIALHLIDPRRAPRVLFPGAAVLTEHLSRANASSVRRFPRWLLILIRALIVALAILAFDRPSLRTHGAMGAGERAVIVLDVSASMGMPAGPVTRFDRAKDKARSLIESADPAFTPVALLLSGESARDVAGGFARNREALFTALARAGVRSEPDSLNEAISKALAMLGDAGGTVHLVTDGQHVPDPLPARVLVHVIDTVSASPNTAIASLDWSPTSPVRGETVTASVRVIGTGPAEQGEIEFGWGNESRRVAYAVGVDGQAVVSASFVAPESTGTSTITLTASVQSDGFDADNRRTASVTIRDAVRLATLGDVHPLDLVLAPPGTASRYHVHHAASPADVLGADGVLCAPSGPLGLAYEDALVEAHRHATPIVWIARDGASAAALRSFAREIGLEIGVAESRALTDLRATPTAPEAVRALELSGLFEGVRVTRTADISMPSASQAWLTDAAGAPMLSVVRLLGVLALDPAEPGVARSRVLVPLMHELIAALESSGPAARSSTGFPDGESDRIPARSSASDATGNGVTLSSFGRTERPLAPMLAIGALFLLCVEPLARSGRAGA